MALSKRFIARFGLDNNAQSITNIGVSGASLTQAGAFSLTLTTTATTNASLPAGTITLADTSSTQTLSNKTLATPTLGNSGTDTTTIAGPLSANGGVGSAGQVLTSRGTGLSPEWTTISGGGSGTTTNALTIGTGLTGTSFNGSTAVTIAIDTGVVTTLSGTQTLTNKTLTSPAITGGSINNTPIGATTASTGVFTTVTATDINSTSDARLKKNIKLAAGLNTVKQLNGYEFDFIDTNKHASGVLAQEIEKVLPHLVYDGKTHKSVSYAQIIPYLIEAIKELSAKVDNFKNKV